MSNVLYANHDFFFFLQGEDNQNMTNIVIYDPQTSAPISKHFLTFNGYPSAFL